MNKKATTQNKRFLILLSALFFFVNTCDDFYLQDLFVDTRGSRIITPALEQIYYTGRTMPITWENIRGDRLKIELYDGNEFITAIDESTENDGAFTWTIPGDLEISDNYHIKIIILDNPPYTGNSYFSSPFFIDTDMFKGLCVEYLLDGNGNDTSGSNNHALLTPGSFTTDRFGNEDQAYEYTDNTDTVQMTDPVNGNEISIAMWYYYNSTDGDYISLAGDVSGIYHHIIINQATQEIGFFNHRKKSLA